jgi:hypothetical protein
MAREIYNRRQIERQRLTDIILWTERRGMTDRPGSGIRSTYTAAGHRNQAG